MKRTTLLTLAGLLAPALLLAAERKPLPKDLPPLGEDKPLPKPALTASTLPNGLTVWTWPRPGVPRFVAVLAVRGGTAADPEGMEGIAELLADTLKEGTATRTSRGIAEELQSVGGEISASASDDAVFVSVSALASGAARALEVLADVARSASFPAPEVELAKGNAVQGLLARESTPEFLAQKAFAKAVFGDHPYHVVAPSKETLQAATPEALRREFARRFRPEGALLVVVGDVPVETVSTAVSRSFASWKGSGEGPSVTPAAPPAGARKLLAVHRPGSVQSTIVVGRPTPTVTDPDYYPLLVGNTICAGSFTSRLVENIREDKGYTYSPGGAVQTMLKGGLLSVSADVRNEVTGGALLEIFYELDKMGSTLATDEEMSRAKRYQSGLYLLRNQVQGSVARTLASNWVKGLPPEALGEFVTKVNAVTAEEVRAVGRRVFPSATQMVVVVGDESKIREELAPFGEVVSAEP